MSTVTTYCLLLGLALFSGSAQAAPPSPTLQPDGQNIVIPGGREARAIGLLADVGFERVLPGAVVWDSIGIDRDHVVFSLHRTNAPQAPPLAQIVARHRDVAQPGDRLGREFALKVSRADDTQAVAAATDLAVASILRHDNGGFFQVVGQPSPWPVVQLVAAALAVWFVALLGWLVRHKAWTAVQFRFKPTQLLPSVLQSVLYGYWALHVPEVGQQLPMIAAQIAFAYALDFLLGMTLRRHWDCTFGPLPIVLSANLFVWFPPGSLHLAFVVVAVAVASKWMLQRHGRHIFNPSALGVAVVGAACLLMPAWLRFQDIAHLFAVPPHMLVLVAVMGLVAQSRVPIVLITLGGAVALLALKAGGAWHVVYPFWPALMLALTLLATDPATMPQTGAGRLLFGLAAGVLIWAFSAALTFAGESDFFGKVMPIPLLNLAVPWLDRAGEAVAAKLRTLPGRAAAIAAVCEPRYNWWHMALWVAVAAPRIV